MFEAGESSPMSEKAISGRLVQQLMIRQIWHLQFTHAIIVPGPVHYARNHLQLRPCKPAKLPIILFWHSTDSDCRQLILQHQTFVVEPRARPMNEAENYSTKQFVRRQLHKVMLHLQPDLHICASELIRFMTRLEAVGLAKLEAVGSLFAPFPMARFPVTHYNKRDFCTVHVPQGVQSVQL